MSTAFSAAEAEKTRAAAVLEKTQAETEEARQTASAASVASVPSGYPLVEAEVGKEEISALESPMLSKLVMVPAQEDIDVNEPDEPDLFTAYSLTWKDHQRARRHAPLYWDLGYGSNQRQ